MKSGNFKDALFIVLDLLEKVSKTNMVLLVLNAKLLLC